MSMMNVQKNIATEMQNLAIQILQLRPRLQSIVALFNAEVMSTLTDIDYQELPDLEHITSVEMVAGKNAFDAIAISIGDYIAGANAQKLARIVNRVP